MHTPFRHCVEKVGKLLNLFWKPRNEVVFQGFFRNFKEYFRLKKFPETCLYILETHPASQPTLQPEMAGTGEQGTGEQQRDCKKDTIRRHRNSSGRFLNLHAFLIDFLMYSNLLTPEQMMSSCVLRFELMFILMIRNNCDSFSSFSISYEYQITAPQQISPFKRTIY